MAEGEINGALSNAEWRAVTVALRDAERSGRGMALDPGGAPTAFDRAWRWLTGSELPRPLADPRLDAIRRFVCLVWRQGERAMDMVPELLRFGFTPAQVEAMRRVAA